ncbi:MAG: hydrogenase maturation factor [Butyrivibrio sp.]|nr:hydrogenase maturation factor [Butyrivibrio sp.]
MRIGKIKENALKRSVLKQIKTEFGKESSAAVGADCAFSNEKKAFSATATVSARIDDSGFYAVIKAVNSIRAQGLLPDHVTVNILLPEDTEEPALKKIVADAIEGCRATGTVYAGGHTEVTRAVNRPVITAVCVGCPQEDAPLYADKKAKAGQELVVTRWIALEGTAMLAATGFDELTKKYPVPFVRDSVDFKEYLVIGPEMDILAKHSVGAVHDISSGGVFAALWEMAEAAGLGLRADLKSIPIRQETVEICEFYETNPYLLTSAGALLIATDEGEALCEALLQAGINARIIGRLSEGNDRIIVNGDEERFLDMPQSDEILKILG